QRAHRARRKQARQLSDYSKTVLVNVYPGSRLIPAHESNYRICIPKRAAISLIVIHVTDGREDPARTAAMFATPKEKRSPPIASSAHFIVGRKLEAEEPVIQSVDLGDVAFHAHTANAVSVGIEHNCRTPGELGHDDPGLPPTQAQYEKS